MGDVFKMQSSVNYQDILNKIEQNGKTAYTENQSGYASGLLYDLVLFLRDNDVPFSEDNRGKVNDILAKASSGNVSDVISENMVLMVKLINQSIYDDIEEQNNSLAPVYHKPVKSYFYKSDFANNLLFSFISSTSNDSGINNYGIYTVQTAMCVKELMSKSGHDNSFYGEHKNDLIDALDLPERDNAAALCRLMYVKKLSGKDALKSIKDILKSVMEYKFKGKNDFISVAYCKYFCAQIDKLKLNNGFDKQTNQIINSANAFFGKDFIPDLDEIEIKEFLPEFKMPDKCADPEQLLKTALYDVRRENTYLVDEQRRLKNEVMKQSFKPEDDVDAWKQHYKKLIKFYDAFQTKDINPVGKLTQGQKDYAFLCSQAEIFKAVMEQCCQKENKSTKKVEYYYDNIKIVNNVTQKIIAALKSNNDNEKNVIFGLIDLFVSDKQAANISQLQIIDNILSGDSVADPTRETLEEYVKKTFSELDSVYNISGNLELIVQNFKKSCESGLDFLWFLKDKKLVKEDSCGQIESLRQNINLKTLESVKNYFENKAKNLESQYQNGSTKDFDKAVSDFLTTSKNDLKALEYLVQKGIIKEDAYEQYKTKLDNAKDLNCVITALYWFVNLLGAWGSN